jgi:cell wall-associated NlpC family hydrolase
MTDLVLDIGHQWSDEWDCYEAIREFYKQNFNLSMGDYARPENWWVKDPELDLLRNNFLKEGFEPVVNIHRRDMQIGDVLLMAIGAKVISHCAVFVGNNYIFHAPFRETSRKDLLAGFWRDKLQVVGRNPKCKWNQTRQAVDLFDLLPENKRRRYRDRYEAYQVSQSRT